MTEEPTITDGTVRFRIVLTLGPIRSSPSSLRFLSRVLVAVLDALRPWRDAKPAITVHVEHDVLDA